MLYYQIRVRKGITYMYNKHDSIHKGQLCDKYNIL